MELNKSYLNIKSYEGLEKVLNGLDDEELQEYIQISDIPKIKKYFDLGKTFENAYWQMIGRAPCKELITELDSFQEILKDTFAACNEISPIFLNAVKCHKKALEYFQDNQLQLAMGQMAETGKLAEELQKKYLELEKRFDSLQSQVQQTAIDCTSSEAKTDKLWEIRTALLNISTNFNQCSFDYFILSKPDLADPICVDSLTLSSRKGANKDFCCYLETFAEGQNKINHFASPKKSLSDVVGSMRSGTRVLKEPKKTAKMPIVKEMLKFGNPLEIETEFGISFFKWMSLAKVNKIMIDSIREAIEKVNHTQEVISLTEKDPLAIALHKSVQEL